VAAERPDAARAAEYAAHRGRPHGDDHRGLDDCALQILPPAAAIDLMGIGPLVQAALAAHLVLEVLDRIGDEHLVAGDAGVSESTIQHPSGGPDERQSGQILLVTGLLADQHDRSTPRPLPRHRLRRIAVQRTAPALVLRRGKG
jgi:hypothetical protein